MSTKDVIKSSIMESLAGNTYLDAGTILGILFFAALIGVYVYLVYRFSSKTTFYSKDLNITMADTCDCSGNGRSAGSANLEVVRIPDGVQSLTPDLLTGTGNDLYLVIPNDVTEIDPAILAGRTITIVASTGSTAEAFARENDLKFLAVVVFRMGSAQ